MMCRGPVMARPCILRHAVLILMALLGTDKLADVVTFPFERA